ncbi:MAG TPA: rhamnulokinase family protein [Vicinamibacterales bacterium]|nr:rhamnulokinase family protein [Vicinamibacterales bacterium]
MTHHLAIDLGAESGRALLGRFDGNRLSISEVRRFPNTPVAEAGTLRWDVQALWSEIHQAVGDTSDVITSVGVDAWGCDYALLDERGDLVERPYHYRDHRTDHAMASAFTRVPRDEIYRTTGIQFLPFNTLFQLHAASQQEPGVLDRAARLVTIPDLMHYWMTGRAACEFTNATTTQCVDASTRKWAASLIDRMALPARLFGPIIEAGTTIGRLRLADGRSDAVDVVAPACHDTGSAVAAVRASKDTAFLSSGTWSLLGVELPSPVISDRARDLNFTNEGGVLATTRLLKNIAGLWLLQACRRDWSAGGETLSYEQIVAAAAKAAPFPGTVIDPDDPVFLNPPDMTAAIADACRRTGQGLPVDAGGFARTIFDSLALKYRVVLESLEELTGRTITTIRVIGGGARNRLLNRRIADATGRIVIAGPVEATALGNLAMQLIATGQIATLDDARDLIERSFGVERFEPEHTKEWEPAYRRFCDYLENPVV